MEWYQYIGCFFAGAFLCNAVPHFVHGISGDKFPTPFAKPPGKGLSSPTINIVWAIFNLIIGYILFVRNHIGSENPTSIFLFFVGVTVMGVMLSINFQKKDKEW